MNFIKEHKLFSIFSALAVVLLLVLVYIAFSVSNPQNENPIPTNSDFPDPATAVVNSEYSDLEQTAILAALDFIYDFSNYGETTIPLEGVLVKSTDNFKPQVQSLINELQSNPNKTSNLFPSQEGYEISISTSQNPMTATVLIPGSLQTSETPQARAVTVKQVLVFNGEYWQLDSYEIL